MNPYNIIYIDYIRAYLNYKFVVCSLCHTSTPLVNQVSCEINIYDPLRAICMRHNGASNCNLKNGSGIFYSATGLPIDDFDSTLPTSLIRMFIFQKEKIVINTITRYCLHNKDWSQFQSILSFLRLKN